MEQALQEEVRRQAMLQVMGLDVWLPRQLLPYAAPTPDWLLEWPPVTEQPATTQSGAAVPQTSAHTDTPVAVRPAGPDSARASLQQVRQALESGVPVNTATPESAPVDTPVADGPDSSAVSATPPVPEQAPAPVVEIPRFSLQLLRSGPCLLLADLPLGEAFQSSDPDFQLLRDILNAAGLPQPQMLRRGEPVRWPLLTTGALAGTQDASAARACVRDLLEHEYSQQTVSFVWLLGPRAMRFANAADEDADLFALTPLQDGIRLWNLPSLEQLMQQHGLKPQLWYHLQKLMPHWVRHD